MARQDSYIHSLHRFDGRVRWAHAHHALSFSENSRIRWELELPSREEAATSIGRLDLSPEPMDPDKVYSLEASEDRRAAHYGATYLSSRGRPDRLVPQYPLVYGYSDIFIVGSDVVDAFCHYCGVFAAGGLFVEIAIPTALALATPGRILQSRDSKLRGTPLWGSDASEFAKAYGGNLEELLDHFPPERLFVHPVKLSQWADPSVLP
jgi:hypothetical protein